MLHSSIAKMRDRRNTNLSTSSSSSSNSSASSTLSSLNEKRYSSPPPSLSPELPPPITAWNQPKRKSKRVLLAKILVGICSALVLWKVLFGHECNESQNWVPARSAESDFDADGGLSLDPKALVVTGPHGTSKWTISIPQNTSFPLASQHYQALCKQGSMLHDGLLADQSRMQSHAWRKQGYRSPDKSFLDIDAAEKAGLIPKSPSSDAAATCDSSLTFVLESDDASFGNSLLMLWLSYGLAQREGRSFFIDDSRWTWGKYTKYFLPPPTPKCSRPPAHHIVPCPHSAKHLVVSSATASWTFGKAFHGEFIHTHKRGVVRQARIYELVRTGYKALFKLTGEDSLYAASRTAALQDFAESHDTKTVGIQIRRGDLHPHEFQYSRDYLPLERYTEHAHSLLRSLSSPNNDLDVLASETGPTTSPFLLASDDPDILSSSDLHLALSPFTAQPAQNRIHLATKSTLDQTSAIRAPGSAYVKHIDENAGWEGGFYAPLFFSLVGRDGDGGVRELVARGYVLDLAVLGQSDGVVCAVSSAACRILGVAMGWEAVTDGRWVNVDDGRGWSWDGLKW